MFHTMPSRPVPALVIPAVNCIVIPSHNPQIVRPQSLFEAGANSTASHGRRFAPTMAPGTYRGEDDMRRAILAGIAALALSVPAHAQEKLKVGVIATLSGPPAVLGQQLRNGFQ